MAKRRRLTVAALSVAAHVGILLALVRAQPDPPRPPEPWAIQVALVTPPPPPEPPTPPAPEKKPQPAKSEPEKKPEPAKPKPPRLAARPARTPPPDIESLLAAKGQPTEAVAEVSEADLAGAGTAESGGSGGGGACNMTRRLQLALRKDPLIQSAVAQAHRGQAILVWNGDWVRHAEQDGAGLAAVREAIMWEVGFAPAACRAERVHGLILISMNDGPGAARLVVGHGDWRWVDLLGARGGRTYER